MQKHQAFEAEIAAHSNSIVSLNETGTEMIGAGHFASASIQVRKGEKKENERKQIKSIQERLDALAQWWESLLTRSKEKGTKLVWAQKRVEFIREVEELMSWISDKVQKHCRFN